MNLQSLKETKNNTEKIDRGSIVIGKDILELLSHAMYVNPLSIYREYVQNSADSIDEAEALNLYKKDLIPRIDISISISERAVKIIDNGIGIKKHNFKKRITAFGASKKRGADARGFRGVGRLAGLGYCQELIFRTRAPGENDISEVIWDCRKILELLRDDSFKGDLKDVVSEITQFKKCDLKNYPDQFFEVELKKISRLKNDILLNEIEIKKYLAQVAPAPFSPDFIYKEQIESFLNEFDVGKSFNIFLNNSADPIFKPHQNTLKISDNLSSAYKTPELFKITGNNGNYSAIGWRLDHGYLGAIPNEAGVKGFRIRAGNIQVGNENLLSELFVEKRFNSWAVGEVHVLDKKIQPNGRRDNFSANSPYSSLLNHLALQAKDITRFCREQSIIRNREKGFRVEKGKVEVNLSILKKTAIPKKLESSLKAEAKFSLEIMHKLSISAGLFGDETSPLKKEYDAIHSRAEKILNNKVIEDPLSIVPQHKRGPYKDMIGLIVQCSQSKSVAQSLIDRIMSRLSAKYS